MPKEPIAGLTIHFEPDAAQETVDAIHAGLSAYNRRVLPLAQPDQAAP